jgi:hypothetical protein
MSLATARAALDSNEERREERWWTLANKAGGGTYDKMVAESAMLTKYLH